MKKSNVLNTECIKINYKAVIHIVRTAELWKL